MTFTPEMELQTLFHLSPDRRILSTREPNPSPGPLFALIRDHSRCAWAVGMQVHDAVAEELRALAEDEPPLSDLRDGPKHAARYSSLLTGDISSGPAFLFAPRMSSHPDVVSVASIEQLQRHFVGWTEDELPERSPIVVVFEAGEAVSVCFCARRSSVAAEAGVETALSYRGRGLAAIVTASWAASVQSSGLIPIYSTSWENSSSLAVARKLDLTPCAQIWTLDAPSSFAGLTTSA